PRAPPHRAARSFPTRRSSDLPHAARAVGRVQRRQEGGLSDPVAGMRLLIVEDVVADAELIVHELERAGLEFQWKRVDTVSAFVRSEEHTSELQSRGHLVCRLL